MLKSLIPNFYRKISLKNKLMLIAIIFIIYPIILLGYFGYRNYADVMKQKAVSNSQSSATELTNLLSERIQNLNQFSIQIFYDSIIYETYNRFYSGELDSFEQNNFQQHLQSILFSKYELSEILVSFTGSDRPFQVSRSNAAKTESLQNIENLYKCALTGHGKPVWYVARKDGKAAGLFLTKIIYSINDIKKEIGMLAFKIDEHYLFQILNNFISTSKQSVGLYSSDGGEIFANQIFAVNSPNAVKDYLYSNSNTDVKEVAVAGDTIYELYHTVQPVGWKLVIGISSNVLLKEVRQIARFILLLCAATLPICLILVNYLYNDILRPMNLLIKHMRQIESGDIGIAIESNRQDEFGYVYNTFNKMSQHIKNLIDSVYKKQIAVKDAEMKALQAQINPHFLYNTLEAINWKARLSGADEISEMISAFSYIVDANLNRNNEKFIPVSREVEYIKSYYFLIEKRFGEKIKFNLDVDEETINYTIPKLMIQPAIENAIFHGIEMKRGNGTIDIGIRKVNKSIQITISDDGLGIEESILKKLREDLANDKFLDSEDEIKNSSKIGILNMHRRIRLLYGDEYGLEIFSEAGKGTTVIINLPISKGSY